MKIRLLPIIRTTLLTLFALPVFANAQNSVNAFSSTGSMSVARNQPAATLLPTGKVLVTGGSDLITFKSSAELYDPTTGTFSPTGSMASFRLGHSSTLLLNGKVLVSGGENNSASKPAELYDPLTGVFTPTGIPLGARTNCPATLLQNGNVLFVGGLTGPGPLVEIYDSVTGQFASVDTGSAAIPQSSHSAALLRDGRVLVTGGFGGSTFTQLATAFLYDPVSNVFSQTGSMSTPRVGHASILLGNGRVLIVGGGSGNGLPLNAELYDPLTGTFSLTGLPSVPNRLTHTVTLLPDGAVLVAGGGSGAEVYDPTSGAFSPIIPMITNRITHAAAPLPDGRVLIVGGLDLTNKALASAEAFQRLSPQAPAVLVVPGILGTKLAHCTDPSCQAEDRTVWLTDIVINQELVL